MGLRAQHPRETWDCTVAKKPLIGVSITPELAGGGPLLPQKTSWAQADSIPYRSQVGVAHMPYTQSSHSCLSNGWVSWTLAEVHLFMLITNCQRSFIGWGEWKVNKTRRRKKREGSFCPIRNPVCQTSPWSILSGSFALCKHRAWETQKVLQCKVEMIGLIFEKWYLLT